MTENIPGTKPALNKTSEEITVTINGNKYQAFNGEILLEIAIRENIEIPHLCYDASLPPYGACRLCMVEVITKGKKEMVTSCTLRAKEGLEVITDSPEISRHRKTLFELYLAQAPKSEVIKSLAAHYGVTKTPFFKKIDKTDPLGNKCILCGLCVRVCNEIMGAGAISFVNRGPYTVVSTPFFKTSQVCLGCKACAEVCPTNAIEIEDIGDTRIMKSWANTKVKLRQCPVCGEYYAPENLFQKINEKLDPPLSEEIRDVCPKCRSLSISRKEIDAAFK